MTGLRIVDRESWIKATEAERSELGIGFKAGGCVERDLASALAELTEEEREHIKDAGGDPEKGDRMIPWIISTEARDRDGDVIKVGGWDLKNYRKNPVVLWGHNARDIPIGRSVKLDKDRDGARLKSIALFTPPELGGGFGFMVYELAKAGFLKASSVGFRPTEYERDAEAPEGSYGLIFKKQELLEWSVVSVPSNPEALQGAKSAGINLRPYVEWSERILDQEKGPGLWVPRKEIERIHEIAKASSILTFTVPASKSDDEEPEDEDADLPILTAQHLKDAIADLSPPSTGASPPSPSKAFFPLVAEFVGQVEETRSAVEDAIADLQAIDQKQIAALKRARDLIDAAIKDAEERDEESPDNPDEPAPPAADDGNSIVFPEEFFAAG